MYIQTCYVVLQRYVLEVAGRKPSGQWGSMFVFQVTGCNEYQENSPFLFCVCIQVLTLLRLPSSEFN